MQLLLDFFLYCFPRFSILLTPLSLLLSFLFVFFFFAATERTYFALDTLSFSFWPFMRALFSQPARGMYENPEKFRGNISGGGLLVLWLLLVDSF